MNFEHAFPLIFAGRLLLPFALPTNALKYDLLLSSPLTAYPRLLEGIYLFENNIDPYSGGVFHHSPLLLSIFSTIIPLTPTWSHLLWTFCDGLAAWCLVDVWRARIRVVGGRRDGLVAVLYLLNPYLFLPSLALSTSTLENTLYLLCLRFACRGRKSPALLALAILTHLSLPTVLLVPPIIMLLSSGPASSLASPKRFVGGAQKAARFVGEYTLYMGCLAAISCLVSDGWGWVPKTWGTGLLLPDLTPNPGLWWYFFTEMFDHFRPFFLMVFSVHLAIYVAPVCIKFQHDPLYAAFILQGILAMFKPYPTLADPGLFLVTLAVFPETYLYLRHPAVTALLHAHAAALLPLFRGLWLAQGTGNANFFYASTLVLGMANGAALIDCVWAGLRIAFGPPRDGWEVVQK